MLFAILQKYDFSSKSQLLVIAPRCLLCCLRYCKSTIFQANHNFGFRRKIGFCVVCDTAKVRFFKQITTVRRVRANLVELFAILQKYDFSSKSQLIRVHHMELQGCLRYCKSTIFQANHNNPYLYNGQASVVCDTAKVRFFKQITTAMQYDSLRLELFAILQKYDFSSKSQPLVFNCLPLLSCLRYCKSTIFQANHNNEGGQPIFLELFVILQKYDFSSKSQLGMLLILIEVVLTFNGSINWVEFIFFVW